MTPCYNDGVKRLWPLPVFLLLALPLRAQEGDAPPDGEAAVEGEAAAASDDAPADAPLAEPGGPEGQPSQGGAAPNDAEGEEPAEKPAKEAPMISVKLAGPSVTEMDDVEEEEDLAPKASQPKVQPTATIMKAPKKGKPATKNAKPAKGKGKQAPPPVLVKTRAPVVSAEPDAPPPPAVPLTPITPRNP